MINYANNFRYSAHRVYSDDLGAAIVLFVLIKFLGRPKNKKDSFIIKNVHIITGDGTEAVNRNVYVTKGIIEERQCIPKAPLRPSIFPITADDGTERKIDVSHYSTDSKITVTVSKDGEVYSEEKCVVEKNLSAIRWEKRDSDGTDITAERKDGFIHMTGTFKGKPQDKTFRIADGLWYQTMDMAMPAFIASAQEEIIFYSIGTGNNRGTMGLG